MSDRRRRVVVVGTGGTIAGARYAADDTHYLPGARSVEAILEAVPGLDLLADIRAEQLFQVDSVELDDESMLVLARHVASLQRRDDVDAVVVMHGTDTLEETSYLLHLVLDSPKPVVFVASMRPSDSLSADGPRNIRCGIAVAACDAAVGAGVLVVMNDEIHTARDAFKAHTLNVAALQSSHGALGYVVGDDPVFYRATLHPHTIATEFHVDELSILPRVDVVYGYPGMPAQLIETVVTAGATGLVYAGIGAGNMANPVESALRGASAAGVHVVRASRSSAGPLLRNAAHDDDGNGWLTVADQPPSKARLLLALGLAVTRDRAELQRILLTY